MKNSVEPKFNEDFKILGKTEMVPEEKDETDGIISAINTLEETRQDAMKVISRMDDLMEELSSILDRKRKEVKEYAEKEKKK